MWTTHVPKGRDQKLAGTVEYCGSCDLQVLAGAIADDSFSDDHERGIGLRICTRRVDYGDVSYDDCMIRHLRPCGSTDQQEAKRFFRTVPLDSSTVRLRGGRRRAFRLGCLVTLLR